MVEVTLRVQRLPHAAGLPLPEQASPGSAGLDLRAAVAEDHVLAPGERMLVPTGLVLELPQGWEGQVRPRHSAWHQPPQFSWHRRQRLPGRGEGDPGQSRQGVFHDSARRSDRPARRGTRLQSEGPGSYGCELHGPGIRWLRLDRNRLIGPSSSPESPTLPARFQIRRGVNPAGSGRCRIVAKTSRNGPLKRPRL